MGLSSDKPKNERWRVENMGRLLNKVAARFEERVFELLRQSGHEEVPLSYLHLTRNLDVGGTRLTELAQRARMTKQAMSEIVGKCESIGLVHRVPDPADGRAKVVLFTATGLAWLAHFRTALERAEAEMAEVLNMQGLESIKQALITYDQHGH